jgi:epoxyqueuosine reductase
MHLAPEIKRKALDIGFDLAGIAPISVWADLEFSRRWVSSGYAGEMHYLKNPKRDDPRRILPTVQSVVCVGLIYNTAFPYSTDAAIARGTPHEKSQAEPRCWISRYAWGADYHRVMRAKLEELRRAIESVAPGTETRVYVDTGPVVERAFARYSGIGWTGKNTCLINERMGSWFFLGVVLTSLRLAPDMPAPDRCGSCTRCLEACPTGALKEPYVMDASRCIAYFTIEHKGSIPAEFRPAIGANVFGCDICQDVCPWNSQPSSGGPARDPLDEDLRPSVSDGAKPAAESVPPGAHSRVRRPRVTKQREFEPLEFEVAGSGASQTQEPDGADLRSESTRFARKLSLFNPSLRILASMDEAQFRRVFARSPVKRSKYTGWLRNLCVAMGNSGNREFIPWLERTARHGNEVVREHAAWAIHRFGGQL